MDAEQNYLGFRRVSTPRQGKSGLGLMAQQIAIEEFVENKNGNLIGMITEIESAGNKETVSAFSKPTLETLLAKRRVLIDAIKMAQQNNAIIVVKEVSRLSRQTLVMDYIVSTVKFVSVDEPNLSESDLRLLTHFNELELKKVSIRTKAALSVVKLTRKLGSPKNLTKAARIKAYAALAEKAMANPNSQKAMDLIYLLRTKNKLSYRAIMDILNSNGFVAPRGRRFHPMTVYLLYRRKKRLLIAENKKPEKPDSPIRKKKKTNSSE